mgnify:CR=1 FL=1
MLSYGWGYFSGDNTDMCVSTQNQLKKHETFTVRRIIDEYNQNNQNGKIVYNDEAIVD